MHMIYILVILHYLPASNQVTSDVMAYLPFDSYQDCMEVVDGAQQLMKQSGEMNEDGPINGGLYCLGIQASK